MQVPGAEFVLNLLPTRILLGVLLIPLALFGTIVSMGSATLTYNHLIVLRNLHAMQSEQGGNDYSYGGMELITGRLNAKPFEGKIAALLPQFSSCVALRIADIDYVKTTEGRERLLRQWPSYYLAPNLRLGTETLPPGLISDALFTEVHETYTEGPVLSQFCRQTLRNGLCKIRVSCLRSGSATLLAKRTSRTVNVPLRAINSDTDNGHPFLQAGRLNPAEFAEAFLDSKPKPYWAMLLFIPLCQYPLISCSARQHRPTQYKALMASIGLFIIPYYIPSLIVCALCAIASLAAFGFIVRGYIMPQAPTHQQA